MQRYSIFGAIALCAAVSLSSAQGGAAVITLVMPPPGGDGHSALQSGTAAATGVASAWYNPALLSDLGAVTGSHVHFASSSQDLNLVEDQEFSGAAVVYPGLGSDFGIAIYRNTVDFGEGFPPGGSDAEESVYGLAAAVGLTRSLDLGLAAKYYRSEIGTGRADGWAFDLGVASSRRFRPLKDLPSLDVVPAGGIALRNVGPEVSYVDAGQSDPLPRVWSNGLGLNVDFADVAWVTFAFDLEREVHRQAEWSDPWQRKYGYTVSLLGFRYGEGWLRHSGGERREKYVMHEYEFNLQRILKVWTRAMEGDFVSPSSPARATLPGTGLWANPRFVIGTRETVSGGLRRGEKAERYFSVAL